MLKVILMQQDIESENGSKSDLKTDLRKAELKKVPK